MHFYRSNSSEFGEVKRLGTGGMAEIFLVERVCAQGIRKKFILKRIHHHFLSDSSVRAQFLLEARIHAQLDHPNIVHFFDFTEDGDFLCLALEHVDGGDLCSLSPRLKRIDPIRRAQVGLQALFEVSSALNLVHEQAIHQDISPGNILYSNGGFFKICDFGLAKLKHDPNLPANLGQGKLRYMSPEQISGTPTDQRSDIFSLGICMAELFSGKKLYSDLSVASLPRLIRTGTYLKHIHSFGFPSGFDRLIYDCIQPSPADRFQNAGQLLAAVTKVQSQFNLEHGCFGLTTLLASSEEKPAPAPKPILSHSDVDRTMGAHGKLWARVVSILLSLPVLLFLPWIIRLKRSKDRASNALTAGSSERSAS